MAPMVTDSYLNFNSSEFGRDKSNTTNGYYTTNKPPLPSMSFNSPGTDQSNNYNNLSLSLDTNNFKKKYASENTIIDLLKGNNYKQQVDLFEDLITQSQNNSEYIINFKNLNEFHSALGFLLYNTISNDVQRNSLKFLQTYFKQIDKHKKSSLNNNSFKKIDTSICENLLEYLISASISPKLQLKQISIDLIYTLMKLTEFLNSYFDKFIKLGIENSDIQYARTFMETTLFIVLTDEFETHDFNSIIKALINKLTNLKLESSAMKCLNKIENILKYERFQANLNKLPLNIKTIYMNTKNKSNTSNFNSININSVDSSISNILNNNNNNNNSVNLKFNLINDNIVKKLSGEDEIQRLQAIKDLEQTVKNIIDIRSIYPYYQDFIIFMNDFVDDSNYEIRLASLKLLTIFIEKLDVNVNQCFKAICQCARQVMSQTHQSKTIKQALNTMLLLTIDNMTNPVLVLECLLYKIKDRSAKAREEFLNIIITAVLIKFSDDKYDSLRKVFFQVVPLLCDIKRNVRHAALECIAVLFTKIKQTDRNANNLLEQLEHVPDLHDSDNVALIREVISHRLKRNILPKLNSDMSLEYGIKIPTSGVIITNNDVDIEWVVSASSSSSASASNLSSARSQKSILNENTNFNNTNNSFSNFNRMLTLNDKTKSISTGSFRRPSGSKRMPWDELNDPNLVNNHGQNNNNNGIPKVMRSREVAPLKAFPLNDEFEFLNSNYIDSTPNSVRNGYPSSTSYQEKYLKKLQGDSQTNKLSFNSAKIDSQLDLNDITDTVKRVQSEKAYSLDNLYNIDDTIQKRKIANINLINGIIPTKPTIPRRNSATKVTTTNNNNNNNSQALSNRSSINYKNDYEDDFISSEDLTNNKESDSNNIKNKYDTVPNIRNSAKNRKKLEKIFAIGSVTTQPTKSSNSNNSDNIISLNTNNSNNNNQQNKSVVYNRGKKATMNSYNFEENNLYLSKLRADKMMDNINNNISTNNTSRYSPSNPESGIFSMSDYDHGDSTNRFIRQQQLATNINNNETSKKQSNHLLLNNDTPHSLFSTTAPSSTNFLDITPIMFYKEKSLKSYSKINIDNNNNINKANNNSDHTNSSSSVSIKANTKSDVEIVGFKLGNSTNNNNNNQEILNNQNAYKKKNSLRNLNDSPIISNENENNNDVLDIVGKGYSNSQYDPSNHDNYSNDTPNLDEADFPLSLSFRTRLRQKTQEKIDEKYKKRVEKIKREKKKELESLNTSINNPSPPPETGPNENFGLSISGYQQNNNNISSKPPIYNQYQQDNQQIYSLDNYPPTVEDISTNRSNYNRQINGYSEYDYQISEFDFQNSNNTTSLPSLEKPKFKPTNATQARLKAKAAAAAAANNSAPSSANQTNTNNEESKNLKETEQENGVYGTVKEDYVKQPFKNAENAFKEAMNMLSQEDWEKKCHAMNIIRRLSVYHEDLTVNNIHTIVLALLQEVKNLRSQVSRFALLTFGDLFSNLKKYMDVDLDIAVKTILAKNGETSDFIRADVEKCLDKMVTNVTTHKGLIALINGGASHRNPLIRRTTAQYIYKCCEIMGPGKILSGIKDVTERVLMTSAQFVVDGPVDIRWYGRKIFHMLMSHDEFDRLLVKYLNENTRKNIKEILDTIRVKGPGDVPTESARNTRKSVRNVDSISRSAGSSMNSLGLNTRTASSGFNDHTDSGLPPQPPMKASQSSAIAQLRMDTQAQEYIRTLCTQLRNPDFRERIEAIEKFQVLCETQTDLVIANIVQLFDKFNPCLTDSNSKANYKALNTMCQIAPILGDNLNSVIANVVPLVAQNLASKNSEIQDMAANILDVFVDYLDGGVLVQPFTNIAQHGNVRIRPQIIYKLADLIPLVYSRKQKQIELHVLPTLWSLLNQVKGTSTNFNSSSSMNSAITRLVQNLYEQMGEQLIERASNSSAVSGRNLELLKELVSSS